MSSSLQRKPLVRSPQSSPPLYFQSKKEDKDTHGKDLVYSTSSTASRSRIATPSSISPATSASPPTSTATPASGPTPSWATSNPASSPSSSIAANPCGLWRNHLPATGKLDVSLPLRTSGPLRSPALSVASGQPSAGRFSRGSHRHRAKGASYCTETNTLGPDLSSMTGIFCIKSTGSGG